MTNHSGDADGGVERDRFEKWIDNPHMLNRDTAPSSASDYVDPYTRGAWNAWQVRAQSATQDDGLLGELIELLKTRQYITDDIECNGCSELLWELIAKYRGK